MKIVTFIIFFSSFTLYPQEIEYQLYLKNNCNDTIEKAIFYSLKFGDNEYNVENSDNPVIKIPKSGVYQLISEETDETYEVEISKSNNADTLVSPTIFGYVKSLSFKKSKYEEGISKLNREESRTVYKRCDSLLNGKQFEKYSNGNIRFSGVFKDGFAIGEIKEYYQNGNVNTKLIYDDNGFLTEKFYYDKNGNEIKK